MTVLAWSPLRSGLLTGKHLVENKAPRDAESRMNNEMMQQFAWPTKRAEVIREVVAVAKEIGASPAQVALAWLRYRPVPVIPIIGARKLTQLKDNIRSLDVVLSPEQLQRLNKVSAISLGFPHDFFAYDAVRSFVSAGMGDRIKSGIRSKIPRSAQHRAQLRTHRCSRVRAGGTCITMPAQD